MVDLESEVFLASFEDSNDYFHALSGGPWMILGHYLAAFAWDPQFRVSDDLPPRMVVWIRFPRLPYQYYHHDVLVGLGNLVGKTVRPDPRTQNSVRGKFARIAVEVNLAEPLPKGVFVDGVWQVVEYENLPCFCTGCGRFGHELSGCPSHLSSDSLAVTSSAAIKQVAVIAPAVQASSEPAGEWVVVAKKNRRSKKDISQTHNGNQQLKGMKNRNLPLLSPKTTTFPISSGDKISQKGKSSGVQRPTHLGHLPINKSKLGPTNSGLTPHQKVNGVTGGLLKLVPSVGSRQALRPNSPIEAQSDCDIMKAQPIPTTQTPTVLVLENMEATASFSMPNSVPLALTTSPTSAGAGQPLISPISFHQSDNARVETLLQSSTLSSSLLPEKGPLTGLSKKNSAIDRTLHGVLIRPRKVTAKSGALKKKALLAAVAPMRLNNPSAVPQNTLVRVPSPLSPSALVTDADFDPTRVELDAEFDSSSIEEETAMRLGSHVNASQLIGIQELKHHPV
ncbi:hypothetical protein LINGRAHAP2_LOCUS35285 [Linum grandiflorum]